MLFTCVFFAIPLCLSIQTAIRALSLQLPFSKKWQVQSASVCFVKRIATASAVAE